MIQSEASGRGSAPGKARAILAGSLGNLIEWYDFYIYAFLAIYFSSAFFPKGDVTAQLIGTSGIFAVGFLFRPLGGWFFGWYADRHSRSRSLILSILLMGIGSLFIAVLPSFATIGAWAPVLLLFGRILQGFSTGGQYGTVATYLTEVSDPKRRGFFGSFQYVTLIGGQLCALAVVILLQALFSADQIMQWAWRLPFVFGALAAFGILFLRNHLVEPERKAARHAEAGSLRASLRYRKEIAIVIGLTAGGSLAFYAFSTYMQKFLVNTSGFAAPTVSWIMTAVLIPFALLQPIFGALSDRWGRRPNILAFGWLATIFTVPLLTALESTTSAVAAFFLILAALTINALYTSISGLYKAELFPSHVRALSVNISFGVSNAIFGGSAEYVALRFKQSGWEAGFYWYVAIICSVSLLTAVLMPRLRSGEQLRD